LNHLQFLAKNRRVDGMVVIALAGDLLKSEWPQQFSLPIASVDADVPGTVTAYPDHEEGMYLVTNHLIGLGHRRVAFVDRPQDPSSGAVTDARRRGFDRACAEHSLSVPDPYIRIAEFSGRGGYYAANDLLALPERPTAIAFTSDMQALGAMRAAEERDMIVGKDLAITGYNGVEVAEIAGLTTVGVSAHEMGKSAADALIRVLAKEPPSAAPVIMRPQLIVRRSSGAERKSSPA
jgi:LacI family transcriptional regulator